MVTGIMRHPASVLENAPTNRDCVGLGDPWKRDVFNVCIEEK